MAHALDYAKASEILKQEFEQAENAFRDKQVPSVSEEIAAATPSLFESSTQAYREVLIGCALARILDDEIDVRLPYASQGEYAFNGRSLDEKVVNPFLQDRGIPCSKGPYLNVFRRSVRYMPETAEGVRDKKGFASLLVYINELMNGDREFARHCLFYMLFNFILLREKSTIALRKVARLSLEQYKILIEGLLGTPSGGQMPVLIAVGMLQTLNDCYSLGWDIEWQGINVADAASGAGGDITVKRNNATVLTFEVTERPISRDRVVSTFNTKVSPNGLDDYVFFYTVTEPTVEARDQAKKYFAQGHDINFIAVGDWVATAMVTLGPKCRALFTTKVVNLLAEKGISAMLKQAWNDQVSAVAGN